MITKKPGMCIIWGTNQLLDPTALYIMLDDSTFFMCGQSLDCKLFTDIANVETLITWLKHFTKQQPQQTVYV
jgi:hypothetical protein